MKYLTSSLFVLCILLSSFGYAQDSNPNKLPPCPKPDYSKTKDVGVGGRTEKWHNCYGKYKLELFTDLKGTVLDGEWRNGALNGWGIYTSADGSKYIGEVKDNLKNGRGIYTHHNGAKYIGNYKNGLMNGLGTFTTSDGRKYTGEFNEGNMHGEGILTLADNSIYQKGIWENGKFIREAKVNLPTQNNNIATNTERSDIDRERQQLAVDRSDLERNPKNLPPCPKQDYSKETHSERTAAWHNCFGRYVLELNDNSRGGIYEGEYRSGKIEGYATYIYPNGLTKYVGNFKNGMKHGYGKITYDREGEWFEGEYKNDDKEYGTYNYSNGDKYIGEFQKGLPFGKGIKYSSKGKPLEEGIWEYGKLIRAAKVNQLPQNNNISTNIDRSDIDRERQQLAEERRRLDDEKRQRQQASSSQRINLQVNHTQPNSDGLFFIDIKTNADTASLVIDGKEEGGKSDGNYTLKRIARAGQSSSFKIVATDIYGNTDTKIINVTRTISEAKATYADLNPTNIKRRSDRDAVAIIIGISDYKNLPKADFANDDARVFYDYAIRALSIKPDNIKLLVDGDAGEIAIYKAFKTWLPSKVRSSTDVYVFYSGHGLPTSDGKGLYLLPQQTDRDLISKTAIQMQEVISDIQSTKPKSVTLFLDACYSGQSRTGETLIASARPISIRSESRIFPENFTVITASQNDQISSSNPDLKHGIFSYYLMRGMEGDADTDKDGKITLGEMQTYLVENVGRQAGMMNRKQEPQLIGDANRVLVGR